MCIQYIPIEGNGISNFKFGAMILCPLIWFLNFKTFSRAFFICFAYITILSFSVLYNIESFRVTSFVYKLSFIIMFLMCYDIVYIRKALNISDFENFIKKTIIAFIIVLLMQQLALVLGIRVLPIINLMGYLNRGIGTNSLTLEPSHSARLLTVLAIVYLRLLQIKFGRSNLTFAKIYKYNKWVFLGFLWSMISMGSGTAFIGLILIIFYFLKKETIIVSISISMLLIFTAPYIKNESFNRALLAIESTMTLDSETIITNDNSSAQRILPLLNTIEYLKSSNYDTKFFFGNGIDSVVSSVITSSNNSNVNLVDYGFISYLLSILIIFRLCIHKLWSIETLIFTILLSLLLNNVYYVWACLILLSTTKYFLQTHINNSN